MTSIRSWAIHPALFAPVPPLALVLENPDLTSVADVVRTVAACLLLVLTIWVLLRGLRVPVGRAELVTTAAFFWIFLFAPLAGDALDFSTRGSGLTSRLSMWFASMALGVIAIARVRKERIRRFNRALEHVGGILLVIHVVLVVPRVASSSHRPEPFSPSTSTASAEMDVYHIVLDGFGGPMILREIYGIEDLPLLQFLTERGFEVVVPARANYGQTMLSLAATMNADYIDSLLDLDAGEVSSRRALFDLIQRNRVQDFFSARGYTIVAAASGYSATELRQSDVYVASPLDFSEFETFLFSMTPFSMAHAVVPTTWMRAISDPFERHRRRIDRAFETLREVSTRPGLTYTFVHILSPHPPFVFDSTGAARQPETDYALRDGSLLVEEISVEAYKNGYRHQVTYLAAQLRRTVEVILENSGTPPIIIIQGDHGPGLGLDHNSVTRTDARERLSILSALYLPGSRTPPPPGMTPVNTYRLILDEYFGTDLGLLPDRSYLSTWPRPYDFREIPAEESISPGTAPAPAVYAEPRGP